MKFLDCYLPVSVQWDPFFTAPFSIPNLLQNYKTKIYKEKNHFFEKKITFLQVLNVLAMHFKKSMENIKYTLNANFNIAYSH